MNPTWKSCANKRSILFTHTPGLTEYNIDKPNIQANFKTLNQIANFYDRQNTGQTRQPDILSVSRQSLQSSHKKNTCNCGPAKTKDKEVDCM